jgi:hypothetical protein
LELFSFLLLKNYVGVYPKLKELGLIFYCKLFYYDSAILVVNPFYYLSELILNVYWVFEAVIDVLFIAVLGDCLELPNLK